MTGEPLKITRRSLLGAATATLLLARSGIAAPAIVKGELTPQQFGAKGGDPVADTRGWNLAVKESGATGRPVMASGTYVLQVPGESHWNWANNPDAPVRVAVELASGAQIFAKQSEIVVAPPIRAPSGRLERHFIFGTGLNLEQGSLSNIVFDGPSFDFRDEFGPLHGFVYAIGVTGVDDLHRRNLTFKSSTAQEGRGLLAENGRRRKDVNLRHLNIRQGIYTRYEYGVFMQDIELDGFREGLDFDGPSWDVRLDRLKFKKASKEAQCIDIGGGRDWMITNVEAENTGSMAYIYVKGNAWPTYGGWLNSRGEYTKDYVAPEAFTLRDFHGVRVGRQRRNGESLRIGTYRNKRWANRQPGGDGPRDITIENWRIEGGSQIAVNDCIGLKMNQIELTGIWSPDDREANAALVLREGPLEHGGAVTGSVSNVVIRDAEGMGVSVVAGPGLSLEDITVDGFNLAGGADTRSGVRIRPRRGQRGTARLGRTSVKGGRGGAVLDLDVSDHD